MRSIPISRYLDTNGDGTGTKNAVGNYASAAEEFFITGPCTLTRMIVSIEDVGAFDSGLYGNSIVLTNGITVKLVDEDGNLFSDLTDEVPILANADWAALCHDLTNHSWGQGSDTATIRWTFTQSGTAIHLGVGQKLIVTLNDDFSGLVNHFFLVQGTA